MLRKAKEMAEYVEDWIDCIEEARNEESLDDDSDYEYSERSRKGMRNRYRYER